MKLLRELLSEQGDDISMVRLLSLLCVLSGIGIAFYGVYEGKDLSGLAQVVGVFITSGLAAKVAQKYGEK